MKKGNVTIVNDIRDKCYLLTLDKLIFSTDELSLGAKGLLIYMIAVNKQLTDSEIRHNCKDNFKTITRYINELYRYGILNKIEYIGECNLTMYKYELIK